MKTALKRLVAGAGATVAATALAATLMPGPANAEVIVRWFPYTSEGARSCNSAANAAGPEYYCKPLKLVTGKWVYALARP